VGGDTNAQGWPRALQIVMVSPAEYEYDRGGQGQNNGGWRGPRYWATGLPTLGGDATIDWFVDVVRGGDAQSVARATFIQRWPETSSGSEPIERFIGGRQVGAVAGTWILTKAPDDAGQLAQYEGAVAFDLCGRWGAAKFATLNPSSDSAGSFGEFRVKGTARPNDWNRAKIAESFANIRVEGSLPAARLRASQSRRRV
jgi:hypothetical protein